MVYNFQQNVTFNAIEDGNQIKFIFVTICFTILIEVKLLQQLKNWFVRPMKRILCPLLFIRNNLEMTITMTHILISQTRWKRTNWKHCSTKTRSKH